MSLNFAQNYNQTAKNKQKLTRVSVKEIILFLIYSLADDGKNNDVTNRVEMLRANFDVQYSNEFWPV